MKNDQQHQPNVVASNAMTPATSTQATTANEAAISPMLQKWADCVELLAKEGEPVHQDEEVAPFIQEAEEIRNIRSEKRSDAKLRKMEVQQKAILLAEAQESMKKARQKFESEPQVPYDYTPGPPTSINDIFRAEKARNELIALEREQKAKVDREIMEDGAREFGEEWPRIQAMSQDPRFDHIPKRWPGYRRLMPNDIQTHPLKTPEQSNE